MNFINKSSAEKVEPTQFLKYQFVFLEGQVFIPNGAYGEQKPTKLVNRKTPPNTTRTIPHVPVTIPPK